MNISHHVIAPGGERRYSEKGHGPSQRISTIIFYQVSFEEIERRIRNFATAVLPNPGSKTFGELFDERQVCTTVIGNLLPCNGFTLGKWLR